MIEGAPPGLILILGAVLVPLLRGRVRQAYMLVLPVLGFVQVAMLPVGFVYSVQMFNYELTLVRVDELSKVFAYVFYIASFLSVVFALHVKDTVQLVSGLIYAGAAVAALFVGDLISLFVFWELTAVASLFQIWARRTERSYRAGLRYLIIQVGSGVLLLAGTILHVADTGSLQFGVLGVVSTGTTLIFLAFGVKAGFPLLNGWLQDAYPEATVTGTVFLSAFTTKLAIYALARSFPGTEILVPIGALMAVLPILYAIVEDDFRRVLAYSLNNQLGFMVVGIGIGTEMSLNGTVAHAFICTIYTGLLFMCTGAVLYRTGTIKGSELGGLYKSMPLTATFCIIGAASISAFPLFCGFISKSLILASVAESHHTLTFLVLLCASAGVFLHSGIKVPYFTFFGHDSGIRCKEAPLNMLVAMGCAAFLCIAFGVAPDLLYSLLPYPVDFEPYTTSHVVNQLQLLLFAAAAFVFLQKTGLYPAELKSVNIDVDWLYRKALPTLVRGFGDRMIRVKVGIQTKVLEGVGFAVRYIEGHHAPTGVLGDPWSIGATALWAAVLLIAYLLMAHR
jgi:multicomponent Na+:H+ antiporter subunit D